MFDLEKYQKSVFELQVLDTDLYADNEYEPVWSGIVENICQSEDSFYEFIEYLKTQGTKYDVNVLYSVCDDILNHYPKKALVQTYEILVQKYLNDQELIEELKFIHEYLYPLEKWD